MNRWHWFLALILIQNSAFGYIDPGPGHILVQLIVAMLAGSLFYLKRIAGAVKGLFNRNKAKGPADAEGTKKKSKRTDRAA